MNGFYRHCRRELQNGSECFTVGCFPGWRRHSVLLTYPTELGCSFPRYVLCSYTSREDGGDEVVGSPHALLSLRRGKVPLVPIGLEAVLVQESVVTW
jgi:hypothetical protein